MEISEKIKSELEGRVQHLEDIIEEKGLGSRQLKKAKTVQRNVNLAVFVGGIIAIAGITFWALSGSGDDDE